MENAHALPPEVPEAGLIERARALAIENKNKLAAVVIAGSIALLGSGCTGPEDVPEKAEASAPAGPGFEAEPGVDALPSVTDGAGQNVPDRSRYVDAGLLNYLIKDEASEGINPYTYLFNKDEATGKEGDSLPLDESAPLLDVKMDANGELHYKDLLDSTSSDREDSELLGAVQEASPLIKAAMRGGQVRDVHFRIFAPKDDPEHPEWTPTASAQYIPVDYNDKGEPSMYFFLAPDGMQDTETVALELRHEASHALLEQRSTDSETEMPVTAEEKEAYTQACNVLRKQALTNIQQSGSYILSDLYDMRELTKHKYQDMYTKVINAIENDTYMSLETNPESDARSAVPACYTQGPLEAVLVQARKAKAGGVDKMLKHEGDLEQFEETAGEMIDEWHDLFKQGTIYEVLSESAYQTPDEEHEQWGHPYDNSWELGASTTNLVLSVPEALGENVAELTQGQKDVVNKVIAFNMAKLKSTHPNDAELHKYIDAQYAIYTAAASL